MPTIANSNTATKQEIVNVVTAVLSATTNGNGASLIGIEDSGTLLDAVNVETALSELAIGTKSPRYIESSISLEFNAISGNTAVLPVNAGAVRLYSFTDCLIEFGDYLVTISTNSLYFPAGTEILGIPAGSTHIAVKGLGEPGLITISGMNGNYKYTLTTNNMTPVSAGINIITLPSGKYIRVFSMTDCFIAFGTSTVTVDETKTFFKAGTEYLHVPTGATHMAVKRYTMDGGLYIAGAN